MDTDVELREVVSYASWAEQKAIALRDSTTDEQIKELAHTVVWLSNAVYRLGRIQQQ